MRLLILLLFSVSIQAAEILYIVHWTSQEKCFECGTRLAVICFNGETDCGVPMKTVDHFERVSTKQAALDIANEISQEKGTVMAFPYSGTTDCVIGNCIETASGGATGPLPVSRRKGMIVAIYEAKPLLIQIYTEGKEIPQPPKIVTKTTITLKEK